MAARVPRKRLVTSVVVLGGVLGVAAPVQAQLDVIGPPGPFTNPSFFSQLPSDPHTPPFTNQSFFRQQPGDPMRPAGTPGPFSSPDLGDG